jgi:glycogen(starch) synthase
VIGFIGRIEPRKGQLDLVRVAAALGHRFPRLRLELVGPVADEGYASTIRQLIREQRLAGVTIRGHVRDPHARARAWDLFVSLSADEGQGLAVLEAMALGVPVAARPVAGISDFLTDGQTGVALPTASVSAITRTLADALEQPERLERMAWRARRLVERRYDWTRMLDRFDRLYGF